MRPSYYEITDGFAYHIPIQLEAGWNSLLLKFLHNSKNGSAAHFSCRVEGSSGNFISGLIPSVREVPREKLHTSAGSRWLRFPVPVMAQALRVPAFSATWSVFVDGESVPPGREIAIPRGSSSVTLRVQASEILAQPFEFVTAPAHMPLGSWNVPGLEHFSGSMTYEKAVDVPAGLLAERLLLDCGRVGVAAEAWVNGAHVGARPWTPYIFDVTSAMRPGRNQIKVRVVNTEANARAVGLSIDNLTRIDLNGWHGPARLVPYFEREIVCKRSDGRLARGPKWETALSPGEGVSRSGAFTSRSGTGEGSVGRHRTHRGWRIRLDGFCLDVCDNEIQVDKWPRSRRDAWATRRSSPRVQRATSNPSPGPRRLVKTPIAVHPLPRGEG